MQTMPGCAPHKIRHLYLEDTLKLKDSTNKQDVHCFLFTDVFLVCKPLNKKSSDSRMKVIRQPFITDRLIVRELKDSIGFLLIYLNELNVASTYMLMFTAETRNWVDTIKKAQEDYRNLKYSSEQEYASTYQNNYEDEVYGSEPHQLLPTSPRSSSRSSLIHSHSGSQDMSEQIVVNQTVPLHLTSNNHLSIQQQSPNKAISFELGDLRNPSLIVEDADSFARSQSFDNRSPVVTITSPRHERRAFLLRNQQQLSQPQTNSLAGQQQPGMNKTNVECNSSSYLNQNSLSVNVPYIQSVNPVVSVQHPRQQRRSIPNISTTVSGQQTITMNESTNFITNSTQQQSTDASTIQVSVHPPSVTPPPSQQQSNGPVTSPSKRLSKPKTTLTTVGATNSTGRPLPPLPPQSTLPMTTSSSPLSLMSISSRGSPGSMTMSINKPPLVKTKNVSSGVASLSYAQEKMHVVPNICDMESNKNPINIQVNAINNNNENEIMSNNESELDNELDDDENGTKNRFIQQQKRTYRPDRRYHTADSIEHLKKEKDNSIHKRFSWNYGNSQQQQHQQQNQSTSHHHHHHTGHQSHNANCMHYGHHCCMGCSNGHHCTATVSANQLLQPRSLSCTQHTHKCLSTESVCSSSGFSSTGSVPLSVGSMPDTNCDQMCCAGGACCAGLELHKLQLQEEEEDIDDLKRDLNCSKTRKQSNSSDRDSALPVSPALNDSLTSPICYHAHSHSQCSMESCPGVDNGLECRTETKSTDNQPLNSNNSPDIKIDVREMKDGISSVQITLTGGSNTVTRPSKADLKRMKEFLLSNYNMESS